MNQELARRCLSKLMGWDLERAHREFAWLDLIARLKYDGYRGYVAGARFAECLLDWLQQFEEPDRAVAYDFIRQRLVYVGASELQHLVELFYPETVRSILGKSIATQFGIPSYMVWARQETRDAFSFLLKHALFMGLSDGARMDTFRRVNVGLIRNEQVLPAIEMDEERWASVLRALRKDVGDENAQFKFVFLVDDFSASGLTLLRRSSEGEPWDGKLLRFWRAASARIAKEIAADFVLVVHHYLATAHTAAVIQRNAALVAKERTTEWFPSVQFTFGAVFPPELRITRDNAGPLVDLIDRHYNPSIMTASMRVGGEDGRLGFNECGLPVILEHNTPNNSVALLWAEADPTADHPEMRPLFRRRQRHL